MIHRWRLFCCLATALIGVTVAPAADPVGRARTWEVGIGAGASILDAGFNAKVLGYTVPLTPVVQADNLDTVVPTLGFRVGYTMKPWLSLEFSTASGSTGVGDNSEITAVRNLAFTDATQRTIDFKQQQQTVPGIYAALDRIEYDVTTTSLMGQFNIRNRPEERFVFFFSAGGGFASLNANTGDFNDCPAGPDVQVVIADDPALAGDQDGNGRIESPEQVNIFQFDLEEPGKSIIENPEHIDSFIIDCGRMFPTARLVSASSQPDLFFIGKAGFAGQTSPPGQLNNIGQRGVNKINGVDLWTYTLGAGMRWYLKPRHLLRVDARRHFGESLNKDINEFTVGYGYVMGRGRAPDSAMPSGDEVPADPAAPAPTPDPNAPPPDPNAPPPDRSSRRAGAAAGEAPPTYSLVSGR